MQSYKWLYLYVFFNCLLKLSAQKDRKSHWLHLYAFFKRLLKLSARTDAKSHWLHLYAFSPKGVFRCFLKSPAWIDGKSQMVALVRFFQLSPQIVCPNRCKVALIAFVCFSPEWDFKCVLKLSAQKDAKSHWLHFYTFSPEGVFKCFLKLPAWTDGKLHWLHLNDFSPSFLCLSDTSTIAIRTSR